MKTVRFGERDLELEDVVGLARGQARAALHDDPAYRAHLDASVRQIAALQRAGHDIYGVTTGVGASVSNQIPEALRTGMPLNLLRFHGVGTGRILDEEEATSVLAARLASLARGYSGVREVVLDRLCALINLRLLPRIPAEGSVGASGDLTPLSYLAATLVGEREVTLEGQEMSAAAAHRQVGLEPLVLEPKESLAIMNGTSMMTGLACLAFARARALAALASTLTAMTSEAVHGNAGHFDDRIFALKAHAGSRACANWIRGHLDREGQGLDGQGPGGAGESRFGKRARIQDRYSIRCAPHVVGVLIDALEFSRTVLTTELNGVNDNPLIDAESGTVHHGGNFYGGHVCFVMDGLKTAVANVADLLDRQLALLCCSETSDGLPDNLVAAHGPDRLIHHGFKAMQISASALTAEALKLTMPASAFSRSTESHNQDKVSMGTIAARDCLRVLELTESVAAIMLLADCQAVDLRGAADVSPHSRALHDRIRAEIPMVTEDRRQDHDIRTVLTLHRRGELPRIGHGEALFAGLASEPRSA